MTNEDLIVKIIDSFSAKIDLSINKYQVIEDIIKDLQIELAQAYKNIIENDTLTTQDKEDLLISMIDEINYKFGGYVCNLVYKSILEDAKNTLNMKIEEE